MITKTCGLIQECWHQNAKVRHSAIRLQKSLQKIDEERRGGGGLLDEMKVNNEAITINSNSNSNGFNAACGQV